MIACGEGVWQVERFHNTYQPGDSRRGGEDSRFAGRQHRVERLPRERPRPLAICWNVRMAGRRQFQGKRRVALQNFRRRRMAAVAGKGCRRFAGRAPWVPCRRPPWPAPPFNQWRDGRRRGDLDGFDRDRDSGPADPKMRLRVVVVLLA